MNAAFRRAMECRIHIHAAESCPEEICPTPFDETKMKTKYQIAGIVFFAALTLNGLSQTKPVGEQQLQPTGRPASKADSRSETSSATSSSQTNGVPGEAPVPPQYAFIQTNLDSITFEEVTNRIGPYTHVGHLSPDDPELTFEFDMPDHSALLVMLERPFDSRNRVHRVRHLVNTNDFHLYP
jgi:hypothetical protein